MEYFCPKKYSEALNLLSGWKGRARLIAGGTNVIPDLRAKVLKPGALIDLSRLKNLSYIREEKGRIRVGGLTPISELATSRAIQKYAPILSEAARQLGNPLVRNRATLAGNLANGSPAADTAVPLLCLEARVVVEAKGRKPRPIPIDQFFIGPNHTVLKNDEVIREIIFPKPKTTEKMVYAKLGLRNSMAISVVSLAVLMALEKGECKKVRIGLGAVAPTPLRAYRAEAILERKKLTGELLHAAIETVANEVLPISDIRASSEYRRWMSAILARRAIQKLASAERE